AAGERAFIGRGFGRGTAGTFLRRHRRKTSPARGDRRCAQKRERPSGRRARHSVEKREEDLRRKGARTQFSAMPIYEYYCPDNHTVYQFYARTLAQGRTVPPCPDNPKYRMQKIVSSFAVTSGRASEDTGADAGVDPAEDARMEAA